MKQIQADAHVGRGEDTASFSGMLAQATDKVYQVFILSANFSGHHSPASQFESLKSLLQECTSVLLQQNCALQQQEMRLAHTQGYIRY